MKRHHQGFREFLDQTFARFRKLPLAEVDSAWERVLVRLQEGPEGAPASAEFAADSVGPSLPMAMRWPLWAAATAAVLFAVFLSAAFWPGHSTAVVESVDGGLYRLAEGKVQALRAGERLEWGEILRSNGGSGAMLALSDGSRVEMRSQTELSVERAEDGVRIHLRKGSLIINAAKQLGGHLYVQTRDFVVSVVGTVFLVNAEEEGSRVAVIEGEVRIQEGAKEKKLRPGEQVTTGPLMESLPMKEEIAWSRHAEVHMALLKQSTVVPTDTSVAFEVVSVRPTGATGGGERGAGGGGVRPGGEPCGNQSRFPQVDPKRFATADSTLLALILWAYGKDCQIWHGSDLIAGGPAWIKSDGFDVEAVIPAGSPSYTAEHLRKHDAPNLQKMLQTLLAERFRLILRREMREIPSYVLTFSKSSPKLTASKEGDPLLWTVAGGRDPEFNGLVSAVILGGKQSMTVLAKQIGEVTRRPVLDRTGLTGEFNYSMKFTPPDGFLPREMAERAILSGPPLFTAIEELGLKLEASKDPVEVLVIEHVEKPSEN